MNHDTPAFWMCYVEGGRGPAVCHPTLDEARAEAQRLALHTKKRTFILKPVSYIERQPGVDEKAAEAVG